MSAADDAKLGAVITLEDGQFKSGIEAAARSTKVLDKATHEAAGGVAAVEKSMKSGSTGIAGYVKGLVGMYVGWRGIMLLKGAWQEYSAAATEQIETEAKLSNALLNTRGNTQENIESIKRLADQLRKSGVVDDDTILAGAQKLATYKLQGSTIEKLLPVMADYIAKNNGLNSTAQSGEEAAQLFGSAMLGQTRAFRVAGIALTEQQKKIFEHGTNTQKADALVKIFTQRVGGMNAALTATDSGEIVQAKNEINDMQKAIGQRLIPITAQFYRMFMTHSADIANAAGGLVTAIEKGMGGISASIDFVRRNWDWLKTTIQLTGTALLGYYAYQGGVLTFTKAQALWNVVTGKSFVTLGGQAQAASLKFGIIAAGAVAWMSVYQQLKEKYLEGEKETANLQARLADVERRRELRAMGLKQAEIAEVMKREKEERDRAKGGTAVAEFSITEEMKKQQELLKQQSAEMQAQKVNIDDFIRMGEKAAKKAKDEKSTTIRNTKTAFYNAIDRDGVMPYGGTEYATGGNNTRGQAVTAKRGGGQAPANTVSSPSGAQASPGGTPKQITMINNFYDCGKKTDEQLLASFIPKLRAAAAGAL
jgi:hypothetical protein